MLVSFKDKVRNVGFWMGIIGAIYLLIAQFVKIDEEIWNQIVMMVAAVLIEIGILTDTSGVPTPLTKESFLEKLKSPVVWGETFALIIYVLTVAFGENAANIATQITGVIMAVLFGVGTYNNPNDRQAM